MESIFIRNFHKSDLDQLTNLFYKHTFHPEHEKSTPRRNLGNLYLHSILNVPPSLFGLDILTGSVAIVGENKIAGVVIARRFPLGKTWIIGPVAVHRNFRRLQIATKLIKKLIADLKKKKAKRAILSVERSNYKGRLFFEKIGFNYLNQSFINHDKARNYARKFALVHSYTPNFWHEDWERCSIDVNKNYKKLELKTNTRMWYILEKNL
jgi:ribosomal protein S18 acetylase RimI-like enzyme